MFDNDTCLIFGHRGFAGKYPENTLPSIKEALSHDVDGIEVDVHTVEDQLIVIHDDTVDRTTYGSGKIADCTLTELRKFDAGNGAQIPLLSEVFTSVPDDCILNVELKGDGTAKVLARDLGTNPRQTRSLLVSSFRWDELREFRALCPDVPVGVLAGTLSERAMRLAEELSAVSINLSDRHVSQRTIENAAPHKVLVYTVNDYVRANQLREWGVRGIFTDRPDLLLP